MKTSHKWLAAALVAVILVLMAIIGQHLPGQLDLTSSRLYTLSPASKKLVENLDEPVTLEFFFSRSIDQLPIRFKNYATRVQDLLGQYARLSKGRISLKVIDPLPDTEEEEAAIRAGLSGQPLGNGDSVFFGLRAVLADNTATIPFFTIDREAFLEYDISQLLYQVRQLQKPVVGIISGLDIDGGYREGMQQPRRPWVFLDELRKTYEVKMISDEKIPDGLNALLVIHPRDLDEATQFAIDQFLLSGKPVCIAVDPSSVFARNAGGQQAMMMGMPPQGTSSDLPRLFKAWGIDYKRDDVVVDPNLATPVSTQRGAQPTPFAAWLSLRNPGEASPLTANLHELLIPEAGAVAKASDSTLDWIPLLQTTDASGIISAAQMAYMRPENLNRSITRTGEVRTIAALIQGTFATAFPDGAPKEESKPNTESAEAQPPPEEPPSVPALKDGKSTLLVIADTDFLFDEFSVRVMNLLGMRGLTPLNDNLALLNNIVDSLSGNPDLVALRGKGSATRPFTLVEAMEKDAQDKYQEQLETLEKRLNEVRDRLRQLQQEQQQQQLLVASPETMEAIEKFRKEEADVRGQQREIRKKLRESIESLNIRLALANMLTAPLLIGAGACVYFWKRQRRH